MYAYKYVTYRYCTCSLSVKRDLQGYNPCVFNGESSFAKTSTEIPSSYVQENLIEYADLRDMLYNMFPIQDMAFEPMEEVPSVQQPT